MTDQPTMCERMIDAATWIRQHAGDARLTLRRMAEAAGFASAFQFHRTFAYELGPTPAEWREHCRREAARHQAAA